MKKLIVAATVAAAMFAASSVTAIADEATGSIVRIETTSGTVMLDDGKWFFFPTAAALADFKVGQKVKIVFDAGGRGAASSITVDR